MHLKTNPTRWQAYSGKWHFSIYDDYCLTLRPTRSGVSLKLRDLDWEEDCELVPLRASDEQLLFRLFSERLHARLRLYPDAAGQGLIIEVADTDWFRRRPTVEVAPAREVELCPEEGEGPPDWALGTWVDESDALIALNLRRGEAAGRWQLALWYNQGNTLPRLRHDEAADGWDFDWTEADADPLAEKQRRYCRIVEFPLAGHRGIEMVWQTSDALNRRREATLFFDAARQRLGLTHTRRVVALRAEP